MANTWQIERAQYIYPDKTTTNSEKQKKKKKIRFSHPRNLTNNTDILQLCPCACKNELQIIKIKIESL